jgi:hypothetical protein
MGKSTRKGIEYWVLSMEVAVERKVTTEAWSNTEKRFHAKAGLT